MAHLDESWLDDAGHLERCDSRGSLRALATAGAQVREALTLAREAGIDDVAGHERPRSVLVGALGGSERVGDVLQTLAQPSSPVPVMTRRDVPLPGWVGPLDLVIAVSLSGRAEGPLALAAEAARRGASLLTVGADDSPLADVCARARGVHIGVGRGRVSSRTSLWSLLTPVLMGARRLGLVDVSDDDLLAAAATLDAESETLRPSSEHFVNPAKLAALQLAGTVPVALADGPVAALAARRASSMFARTARVPMTWGELPDDAADLVATLDGPFTAGAGEGAVSAPDDIFADPFLDAPRQPSLGFLTLHSDATGESDAARDGADGFFGSDVPGGASGLGGNGAGGVGALAGVASGIQESARAAGAVVVEMHPDAGPAIARTAQLMHRVDFTATYLALGQGLDPAVSRHVTELRDRLGR